MSKLHRWNGSSWVLVPDGTDFKYWNGSAWVNPTAVKYWDGDSWETAWSKSDPKILTFTANFTTNLRHSSSGAQYDSTGSASNDAKADLYVGRYGGSVPYHFLSLMGFKNSNEGGTLAAELAVRPAIKTCAVYLRRRSGAGLGSPSGNVVTGIWTQSNYASLPATTLSGTHDDWSPADTTSISGWAYEAGKWVGVDPQHVWDIAAGKALIVSEVTSGYTTSGGTTNAYSRIYGLTDVAKAPVLKLTLDYA